MNKRRRVFITGAGGTIGRAAAKTLVASGYEVFGFGLGEQFYQQHRFFDALQDTGAFRFETGSILDRFATETAMRGAEIVIHLAAMVGGKRVEKERLRCFDINVNGTNTVLAAAVASGVKHVVLASSSAVYGNPDATPVDENAERKPLNLYGVTKLAAEELLGGYAQSHPTLKFTIARLFNTYGDDISGHIALNSFVECVVNSERPIINGDGEQRRCYVHAEDVSEAIVKMLERPIAKNRIYNIGNPSQVFSLNELARKVIDSMGPGSNLTARHTKAVTQQEARDVVADTRRAESELGFVPRITVENGLKRIMEAVRQSAGRL